ncbi:orotidine-5'-phosphate decarboxylase [Clostridiaceae bacterium M8S5]|nr:orotidine-5'-phosphate decarboxylase [Clostridiaceae bacterium M8S5]
MFVDRLIENIILKKNHSVVGLDPRINFVPKYIRKNYETSKKGECEAILEFNKIIIDNIKDIVACVKPQIAFYESYGIDGLNTFVKTIEYAKQNGLSIIADIKRGDIGSTAEAYAKAYFEGGFVDVDSVTLNPYLGIDSIKPFLNYCDDKKGVFILDKTSNKSSKDIQDLKVDDKYLYEIVGKYINEWGEANKGRYGYSNVGAVVGATYPREMKVLREIMKSSYILVPGYGAQGGTAKDIIDCFNEDGLGAVINSSRGIIAAHTKEENSKYGEKDFGICIREAAIEMRDSINKELEINNKLAW